MSGPDVAVLHALLAAHDPADRDRAWAAFLELHSILLLRVARSLGGDHDAVMDRYAFVVEALQANEFQRLHNYLTEGRGAFGTWLVVVARRLCMDQYRHRYGRLQSSSRAATDQRASRRSLVDLVGSEVGLATLPASEDSAPDLVVRRTELRAALQATLGTLPVADRMLLRLRFDAGLPVPEIARIQGEPSPFKVYRRIDRILRRLREGLQAAGVHEASP